MAGTRTAKKDAARKLHFSLPALLNLIGRPFYWILLGSFYFLLKAVSFLPAGGRLFFRSLLTVVRLPYRLLRLGFAAALLLANFLSRLSKLAGARIRRLPAAARLTVSRPLKSSAAAGRLLWLFFKLGPAKLKAAVTRLSRRLRLASRCLPLARFRRPAGRRASQPAARLRPQTAGPTAPVFHLPRLRLTFLTTPLSLPRLTLARFFALLTIVLVVLVGFVAYSFFHDLPNPDRLATRNQALTTKIYDRHGILLYKIYRSQNRSFVRLEDIPLEFIRATIAVEDAEFYRHPGLSWRGIFRAFLHNLESDRLYGGSTITQQLVKNTLLTPERTWSRKIKEAVLAIWVERRFSKDEILQMYLNEVGYGGAVYGAEEAAQKYFGKSVRDLNLAEAAFLAGLPASPNHFSPFGVSPQVAKERQAVVLERMHQEGFINADEVRQALRTDLYLAPQKVEIRAPHFVMYLKNLLVNEFGRQMVEEGGLTIITSLDLALQEKVQQIVTADVYQLTNLKVGNGAALVTKPATGEILAMVGSKDYFNLGEDGNVNVTTRPRQPGSSIKPLMYSLALTKGFTAATIIPDTPITYQVAGQPPYTPHNYDNRYHGNTPLRVALASSYNVPAVKVLSALGVKAFIEHAQNLGITTWDDPSRFGLSLTLGGGEVTMTDMAVAYGTFANLGQKVTLNPILEIRDHRGKLLKTNSALDQPQPDENNLTDNLAQWFLRPSTLYPLPSTLPILASEPASASAQSSKPNALGTPVLDPRIAYLVTDILADNTARTPAFGPSSVLNIPNHPHVAVKTGTTQNLRDNWTIGYSPDYLAAVWVGNNDNTPMSAIASGVTGASPIWQKIMMEILKDLPDKEFPLPDGLVKTEICPTTGTLACPGCGGKWEYFLPGTEPTARCTPKITADTVPPGQEPKPENQPRPRDRKREADRFFEVTDITLE